MSADNYIVIRRFSDGWKWGMGFASDEYPGDGRLPDECFRSTAFESSDEARKDASAECDLIEYGIHTEADSDEHPRRIASALRQIKQQEREAMEKAVGALDVSSHVKPEFQWPEWMQIDTSAAYADVDTRTVNLWIKLGLPCICVGKTPARIKRSDLDEWMVKRGAENA